MAKAEPQLVAFVSAKAFAAWLKKNQSLQVGVWMQIAKKNSGVVSVTYAEALEVALCWGWIDGQIKRFDETTFLQRFTPRRPRSMWSRVNRDKVGVLVAAGRMQAPGLAEVDRAKMDGRWDRAYESASRITVPPDMEAAFDANPKAAAFFGSLDAVNRYAILHRVQTAIKPETRAARIAKFVDMLVRGQKLHQ